MNNTVKKVLYQEKPVAIKAKDKDNVSLYTTQTSLGEVQFNIPFAEQTDGEGNRKLFDERMPAQSLIRWISVVPQIEDSTPDSDLPVVGEDE